MYMQISSYGNECRFKLYTFRERVLFQTLVAVCLPSELICLKDIGCHVGDGCPGYVCLLQRFAAFISSFT